MKNIIIILLAIVFSTNNIYSQNDVTGETALYNELNKANSKLNDTYRKLYESLSIKSRKTLNREQILWKNNRTKICKDTDGGIIGNKLRISCFIEETDKRIKQLQNWRSNIK